MLLGYLLRANSSILYGQNITKSLHISIKISQTHPLPPEPGHCPKVVLSVSRSVLFPFVFSMLSRGTPSNALISKYKVCKVFKGSLVPTISNLNFF